MDLSQAGFQTQKYTTVKHSKHSKDSYSISNRVILNYITPPFTDVPK